MARLSAYKAKRKFDRTSEPQPKIAKRKAQKQRFCIQRHAARRLHYDLRLELDGVLVSFAVPKGPTLDPREKRLAIRVEDHPVPYLTYEGVIPEGNYGAGKVELWDIGTYDADLDELRLGLEKGHVHFSLDGKKMNGAFVLVKLKNDNQWLLRKVDDSEHGVPKKLKKTAMPKNVEPMLAVTADKPFDSPDFIFEIKWDGYRAIAYKKKSTVELLSRRQRSLNRDYPTLIEAFSAITSDVIIDGEVVALDDNGLPQFILLQGCAKDPECIPHYMAFDLLYLNGHDLRTLPLINRKSLLKEILDDLRSDFIHYTDHVAEKGVALFREAQKLGLEGLIAKSKTSTYTGARSRDWQKIKSSNREDFVVVGFTKPRGSRKGFGALLLAAMGDDNELQFVGHVGTGFNARVIDDVMARLKPLIVKKSPLKAAVTTNMAPTWVKPKLIAEISFHEKTTAGLLRQPVFHGIRDDKNMSAMKDESHDEPVSLNFITNNDKIFWPDEGFTKGDMLKYYETMGPIIVPHLHDRPLTLRRYPDGINGADFYQKHVDAAPSWLKTVAITHTHSKRKDVSHPCVNDVPSLLFIANLASIEMHPTLARAHDLSHPDFLVIDLDPEDVPMSRVVDVAIFAHELLHDVGMPNYCKTSGGRGLHIYAPLAGQASYKESLHLAELIAIILQNRFPQLVSLERSPKRRQQRVYVDYLQNALGKTTVAPYSLRALAHATVSTPLRWKEVTKSLDPLEFNLMTMPKRVKKLGDIFAPLLEDTVDLLAILERFEKHL